MYKDGETAINRILELVGKCPKEHQNTCFEVLLQGYVKMQMGNGAPTSQPAQMPPPERQQALLTESKVPSAVLPRFKSTAKRISVTVQKLESLFDFSVDPFTLHAITVPGSKNADKTRNVALVVASRSYLASGSWSADWAEVKKLCVDQNCYDTANHIQNLKQGCGTLFKRVETGKTIELSSKGIQEAEKLIATLSEQASE